MLTLATDPFLAKIDSGTAFPTNGRPGWGGRLWQNQRWMLPSPFYGRGFLTRRMLFRTDTKYDRREWLMHRDPRVFTLTLQHAEFEANADTPVFRVNRALSAARDRWNKLLPVLFQHVGMGGLVWWDLAPRRSSRSTPRLQLHLHAVVEPYLFMGRRPSSRERPKKIVKAAWAESASHGQQTRADFGRLSSDREVSIRQIKYAAGLTKIGARLYPKFMRGFDEASRRSKKPRSGGRAEKPTPDQLRLIHAAYMSEPVFGSRWFGLWDFNRRKALREFSGRSRRELLVNNIEARQYLGVRIRETA
ncbi:MAG: hypothetical protein AAGG07_05700 [Planctomycetota bacterium]